MFQINVPDVICSGVDDTSKMLFAHPTVLDAGLQGLLMAAFSKQPDLAEGAYVPTFMKELTVMSIPEPGTTRRYTSRANVRLLDQRDLVGDVTFYAPRDDEIVNHASPLLIIRGLTCSRLAASPKSSRSLTANVVHRLRWVPDIDLMSPDQIQHHCLSILDTPNGDHGEDIELLERIALRYITDAIKTVTDTGQIPHEHHRKLFAWMQQMARLGAPGDLVVQPNEMAKCAQNQLDLLVRVGQHLPSILLGAEDPLALMVTDRLLDAFYTDTPYQRAYLQVANIVQLMSTKNPHLKVIEIGAGTGGATIPILRHLRRNSDKKRMPLSKFVFTDISTGFFDTAKSALGQWDGLIDYRKLDIENEPSLQGFEGDHDLAIAANVLHATTDIRKTLRNSRALLRPGGKLILMELTKFRSYVQCIFGTLKGWWLGTDFPDCLKCR